MLQNNQNRLDTVSDQNMSRFDKSSDANRDWADNEKRYMDEQTLQKAQTLASYGDFSGYAAMYGTDTANVMREMWIAQNPDLAYRTGAIDAKRYRQMTGAYPPGYSAGGGGGGGYYYGGGGSGYTPKANPAANEKPAPATETSTAKTGALTPGDYTKLIGNGKQTATTSTSSGPAKKSTTSKTSTAKATVKTSSGKLTR
jgi:hypothetical protein